MRFASLTRSMAAILAGATALVPDFAAHAQTYPTKTIRVVVPYPAGGATDFFARTVFPRMSDPLGQQVIVRRR